MIAGVWVVRAGGGVKGKVCGGTVRGKRVGVAAAWERMGGRRLEERGVLFLSRVCVCLAVAWVALRVWGGVGGVGAPLGVVAWVALWRGYGHVGVVAWVAL